MKEAGVFYFESDNIPQGSLRIHKLPQDVSPDVPVRVSIENLIFINDGSLAGDLFTIAVIKELAEQEEKIGIAVNPNDVQDLFGDCF